MKKIYLLLLAAFLFATIGNAQVIITEGFEGGTFPPTGWTRINNSGTGGKNWESNNLGTFTDGPYAFAKTGTGCMLVEYVSSSAAVAWMISPVIAMTAGSTYNISFAYRIRSATYPERMKVTIGNAATVGAQTTVLWDNDGGTSLTNTTYATGTISYNATTTGNFYVGFNCYSPADQWAMIVDDILIEKINNCSGAPTAGTATSSVATLCAAGNANLSLTGASSSTGLSFQWQSSPAGANTYTNVGPSSSSPAYTAAVSASTDYRCVVTCSFSSQSANSTPVRVNLSGVPANDLVCNATALTLGAAAICQNTTCATATGDPTLSASGANNTVWFSYTPTSTAAINAVFSRPTGVTSGLLYGWLGIYTATGTCPTLTLTQLTPTATSALAFDLTTNPSVTVTTPVLTAGTTYYFMIDGFSGAFGEFCAKIEALPTPPACTTNLTPANAATNVAAPNGSLTWNAAPTATAYDIYFGTVNPPTGVTSNITATTINYTGLAFNTTYYWYVVPKNNGSPATGCVANVTSFTTAAPPPAPANDDCAGAIDVSAYVPVNGTTVSATQSQAAEACATFTGNANDDVWFKFTALQNGAAAITLTPTGSFDAVMIAYSGTCGSLTSIGCADGTAGGGIETLSLTGLVAGQTYYFRVYGYGAAGTEGLFTLTASGVALPVSITNFIGSKVGNVNVLSWTTSTEINNAGFELQRSADGNNFSTLSFISSLAQNGNSNSAINYQVKDEKPFSGNSYYRLKQLDKDGKSSFSSVVLIKGTKAGSIGITAVYPNPVKNQLNLVVSSPVSEKITIIITDMTGKVLYQQVAQAISGDSNVQIDVTKLASGNYMIKAVCANGCNSGTVKFVKQ